MASLGEILDRLTDPEAAMAMLDTVADRETVARIEALARKQGRSLGPFVADAVTALVETEDEEVWLSLLGRMANSPRPGSAAVSAILERAFAGSGRPNPDR